MDAYIYHWETTESFWRNSKGKQLGETGFGRKSWCFKIWGETEKEELRWPGGRGGVLKEKWALPSDSGQWEIQMHSHQHLLTWLNKKKTLKEHSWESECRNLNYTLLGRARDLSTQQVWILAREEMDGPSRGNWGSESLPPENCIRTCPKSIGKCPFPNQCQLWALVKLLTTFIIILKQAAKT